LYLLALRRSLGSQGAKPPGSNGVTPWSGRPPKRENVDIAGQWDRYSRRDSGGLGGGIVASGRVLAGTGGAIDGSSVSA